MIPIIYNISSLRGYYYGGQTIVITGLGFDGTCIISFGSVVPDIVRVDSATQITAIAPKGITGTTCNISVKNNNGIYIYPQPFTFYSPVIYKPDNNFKTYLNGKDVSDYVVKQPTIKTELNILVKWDIAFDEVHLALPDETENILMNTSNDRITVKDKNGDEVFLGFIKNKDRDRAAKKILITACPLLSLISKKTGPFISTTPKNAAFILYDLLYAAAPAGFYVDKKISRLAAVMPGVEFYINDTGDLNYMSTALSLCSTVGIGIYLDGNTIKAKAIRQFPATAKQMTLLKKSTYSERQYLNYNKITLKYKTAPGASETAASSIFADVQEVLEYVVSSSNMYFTASAAQATSDRLLLIYSPLYSEADFIVGADNIINVGDYFQPESGYVFFAMTKEQDPLQIKLHGIGVKTT
jgi:hypothetical protein